MAEEEEEESQAQYHSGTESNSNSSEAEEDDSGMVIITDYEKQRLERIKENKARLEALRLPSLASSLFNTLQHKSKPKKTSRNGKKAKMVEDDDEYKPSDDDADGEEHQGSSSSDDKEEEQDWSDDDGSSRKGKTPQSLKKSKPKSKASTRKLTRKLDFVDDEEALQQAIALSLADSSYIMGTVHPGSSEKCRADVAAMGHHERKGRAPVQEEADKRKKRRGLNTSRMQINEDQVIIHFFQFDDLGPRDNGLEHETHSPPETQLFQCRYCCEVMEVRRRTHLVQHLAGSSSAVAPCECVPTHVKKEMREHLSERGRLLSHKRLKKERQLHGLQSLQEEEGDLELKLQRDIEEAMTRSMNDPQVKEMEEIEIAIRESQRINSQLSVGASSSRDLRSAVVGDSDEELVRFLGYDGEVAGKGGITPRDLQRVAVDHDFSWSDKELDDMIHLFDNHRNGRLNLEDFRKILYRCNMIKG